MISSPNQHGNVIFLILIAVALFAALAYAVTGSTRNSSSSISSDKAKTNAAAIIQFGSALRNAVTRMKISSDCTDTTLDVYNPVYKLISNAPASAVNVNAPANGTCNLFSQTGGNMVPVFFSPEALDSQNPLQAYATYLPKPGQGGVIIGQVNGIGTDGSAGTVSANDILFSIPWLNKQTCLAINNILGITNPGGNPPNGNSGTFGVYTNGDLSGTSIYNDASYNGNTAFCESTSGINFFIQSLVDR